MGAVLYQILRESAVMFARLIPYVVAGAAAGAALSRSRWLREPRRWVRRDASAAPNAVAVVSAAFLGTVSPLCTIGTIPVLAGLLHRGMPTAVAAAFLGGSSMTNPQLFLLTAGTLGPRLAVCQWAASVASGITLGLVVALLERGRGESLARSPAGGEAATAAAVDHAACGPRPGARGGFLREFFANLDRVGGYLAVGVVVAAVVQVAVPDDLVQRLLGRSRSVAVVVAALLSAPFYVCGGGALPAMASLLDKGVPAGAVIAFFVAGPATRIQAIAALGSVVRWRLVCVYVAVVLGWAVVAGLAVNRFLAP